jgi:3-oxoacyl-[acyl-carrier-protein] synthase-3
MTNYELAMMVDTSDEWITKKTGIRERRIAGPEEAPSDMAVQAALRCLAQAGVDKAAVDLVIVACATPDQSQPAVACMVQEKLGIAEHQCPAFDVTRCARASCSRSTSRGNDADRCPRYRNVLVIGTDTFSDPELEGSRPACSSATGRGGAAVSSDADERRFHFTWAATAAGASSSRCPAAAPAFRSAPR